MNKKKLSRAGIVFVILFAVFAFFVNLDLFTFFDLNVTILLQKFFPRGFDTFFSIFSLLGSVELTTLILLVLVTFNRKIESIKVLALYLLVLVIEVSGKLIVAHPGPTSNFFRYDIPVALPSFFVHTGSSFPSGHSTRTAFIAVIIAFLVWRARKFSKNTKILIFFVILLIVLTMLVSRVYLGEHWATDVIGGFLLGVGFAGISLIFL